MWQSKQISRNHDKVLRELQSKFMQQKDWIEKVRTMNRNSSPKSASLDRALEIHEEQLSWLESVTFQKTLCFKRLLFHWGSILEDKYPKVCESLIVEFTETAELCCRHVAEYMPRHVNRSNSIDEFMSRASGWECSKAKCDEQFDILQRNVGEKYKQALLLDLRRFAECDGGAGPGWSDKVEAIREDIRTNRILLSADADAYDKQADDWNEKATALVRSGNNEEAKNAIEMKLASQEASSRLRDHLKVHAELDAFLEDLTAWN